MKLAHIINPVKVNPENSSYLYIAQPVTFQSMLNAQKSAKAKYPELSVELYTVQYPEDRGIIPNGLTILPDLTKSCLDHYNFKNNIRKLPLLRDIIQSIFDNSDAEYFVFTNADIGLREHFYCTVYEEIKNGYDGLCIHRQDIPKTNGDGTVYDITSMNDIYDNKICHEHPGHDCVVFKKSIVPKMELKRVFVGYPPVGAVLKTQVKNNSLKFKEIRGSNHLTFHLGSDNTWEKKNGHNGEYRQYNMLEGRNLYK